MGMVSSTYFLNSSLLLLPMLLLLSHWQGLRHLELLSLHLLHHKRSLGQSCRHKWLCWQHSWQTLLGRLMYRRSHSRELFLYQGFIHTHLKGCLPVSHFNILEWLTYLRLRLLCKAYRHLRKKHRLGHNHLGPLRLRL